MNKKQKIIDVWSQHSKMNFINHDMLLSLRQWMGIDKVTEEIPLEFTLGAMDEGQVQKGLICAWWGPGGELISNDEVAASVKRFPDRLVGVGSVNLYRPMDAVHDIRRCVDQLGFKAIRIVQWLWNLVPTDRRYYPVFAECIEQNIPVCLQVGHTGPLCPSEPGRPIPYIDQVALDFPELKMVCGHIGYPWTMEMIAVATKHTNVFIDTSAYTAKRFPQELVQYMKTNGKKKVLFGTNFPMITPAKCLENLDDLELSREVRDLFLYKNAQSLFDI